MKAKKKLFIVLAYFMAFSMFLASCAQAPAASQESEGAVTQSESQASSQETQQAQASQSTTDEVPGLPEQASLKTNLNEMFVNFAASATDFQGEVIDFINAKPIGDMPDLEVKDPEVYSKEQIDKAKRSMRDYKRQVSAQIINNAKEFYCYKLLTKEQQGIYDAYYLLAQDPTTQENIVSFQTSKDINSEEIMPELMMPLLALVYDHPELWWMNPWNGTAEVGWGVGEQKNGKTTLYAGFTQTYANFEKDVAAFNKSVSEFLQGIDKNAGEEKIALAVHDKLIDWVTYDDEVLQKGMVDFAHTAFGPIVANSRGTPHTCVCDGYSQGYAYLCQQLGVTALVVLGPVSNAGADGNLGLHAWNIVRINDRWYEVDSTWDDLTYLPDAVKNTWDKNTNGYEYYLEMVNDNIYMDRLYHYMYCITTKEIANYQPPSSLYYTSRDGRVRFCVIGGSQRWRMHEKAGSGNGFEDDYTVLLPVADGSLVSGGTTSQDDDWDDDDDDEIWDGGGGDIMDLIKGSDYKQIAGTYYVSKFNQYDQATLEQYYGKDYYKQLSMFELKANGSGTIYENGSTLNFNYIFDGSYLYLYSDNGGMLFLMYSGGNFLMSDYYGNVYTFSKLK
ncbi:MAG: hypothetical protein J6Q02_03735 [Lachnospiraceae bacterium]|nr:hypothetical protein [Lachnospiraceae bacterium]